jgi:hypothetical protein
MRLRDQLRDGKTFMAHELALICNKWAELFTYEENINMPIDKFLAKNLEVMQFNQ